MNVSLSNDDIMKVLKGHTKIIPYNEISKYNSIEEILHPYGSAVILYLTDKSYGHWVGLIKHNNNHVEHFDSYGYTPDDEFSFIDKSSRTKYNYRGRPYLSTLLSKFKGTVEYNHDKLQGSSNQIATCGRHCCLRILCKSIPLKQYVSMVKKFNPDKLVVELIKI